MGNGTGKNVMSQRGVNRNIRNMYNSASGADRGRIVRAFQNGATTLPQMRRALSTIETRNAPRRESRARTQANTRQANFDRALLAATGAARTRLRRNAPAGVDTRTTRAGLDAARRNVEARDARSARRTARVESRAAAAAAAAAAATPTRRRGGRRRTNG